MPSQLEQFLARVNRHRGGLAELTPDTFKRMVHKQTGS